MRKAKRDADAGSVYRHAHHSGQHESEAQTPMGEHRRCRLTFVRDYRRKKKLPPKRRSKTDEDFIEGMISEVGMEQDHDGLCGVGGGWDTLQLTVE